jgi:hypothetical protein
VAKLKDSEHKKDIFDYIKQNPTATADDVQRDMIDDLASPATSMVLLFTPEVSKAMGIICKRRGMRREEYVNQLVITDLNRQGLSV